VDEDLRALVCVYLYIRSLDQSTREYLKKVYQDAGIVRWSHEMARQRIPGHWRLFMLDHRRPVVRVDQDGAFLGYAYAWDNGL
jgi:hypothetical protein